MTRYANQAAFRTASVSGTQDNSGQIVENFSFTGAFANASTGDSWFFQPLFLSGISVPEISPQPRVLPLELGSPYHVKGEYRIVLPAGMRVGSVPAGDIRRIRFWVAGRGLLGDRKRRRSPTLSCPSP